MAQQYGPPRPKIILISLEKESWFDNMYKSLLADLKAKAAEISEVDTTAAASMIFNGDDFSPTVIATDGALSRKDFRQLRMQAVQFVENGGTLIFGLHLPSFIKPTEMTDLFTSFSLPWKFGDYHRTELDLNPNVHHLSVKGLVPRYSQKAVHLENVERRNANHLPSSSSRVQSHVFAATPIEDLTQTPAAIRQCGAGKVGYLGDVNAEQETNKVVFAICGLLYDEEDDEV